MLEKLFDTFEFAWRQRFYFTEGLEMLKNLLTFKIPFGKILSAYLAVMELFTASFLDTSVTPYKDGVDLTGYELVFEDDFNGDSLDTDNWAIRYSGVGHTTIGSASQVSIKNGNLRLALDYLEDGEYGEGWYVGDICLKQQYLRGYFEIKARVFPNESNTHDVWSAFWLTNDHAYDAQISQGGVGAVELDIMECFTPLTEPGVIPNCATQAIWCNGVDGDDENVDGRNLGHYRIKEGQYNTFGFLWTEDEYVWYVNGVETVRTSYVNGVCQVPEIVVLSLASPSYPIRREHDDGGEYLIDYIRIYQVKE